MEITTQMLIDEGMDTDMHHPLTPLCSAVYWLYAAPAAARQQKARVVLLDDLGWSALDSGRRAVSTWLEWDDACELLWATLSEDGERTGDVACGTRANDGDYIFCREGNGYRVALPMREQAVAPVARALAM